MLGHACLSSRRKFPLLVGVVLVFGFCFLFLRGAVYLHCILSFLVLCVRGGRALALLSLWKGYFLVFVYVGGMLIMVVYFASLRS